MNCVKSTHVKRSDDRNGEDDCHALTTMILEKVGKVISSAAKDTLYEVEVNQCIVEELDCARKGGIPDKDYLYYRDDLPTTLAMDEDEIVLEGIRNEAQAVVSELTA